MKEDFLQYVWQFQHFEKMNLKTTHAETLSVLSSGLKNVDEGPDFFNARIVIDDQQWAGNVEIHLKSSDWYAHNHHTDINYDNVILHVVYEHDAEIFRKNEEVIPTLELHNRIPSKVLEKYNFLFQKNQKWINCQEYFSNFDEFLIQSWLTRLYIDRLEEKSKLIQELLQRSNNNWNAVLFYMLAKSFGLNKNGQSFTSIVESIGFEKIQKLKNSTFQLEALLLGQAGFLDDIENTDSYYLALKNEFDYLLKKYKILHKAAIKPVFFRLRPNNFPTIRLVQLACLYTQNNALFNNFMNSSSVKELKKLFVIKLPSFWETHNTFKSVHNKRTKQLSSNFINLVLINAVIPLQYVYQKQKVIGYNEDFLRLAQSIPIENNSVVKQYQKLKPSVFKNALHSQGLLNLKINFCDKNRCFSCNLGFSFIKGKY
ncbi:DUF2851 family protein [Zunongwangia sp.]|uniref:DUF2851 family protein n=1 Tax=Zunongwangia sp. TaxID=1965325 RepID=UPI003AA9D0E7